jgi:FtsH-binding integral membrane protein
METKTTDYVYENVSYVENADASRRFIANVFVWMFVALGLSAVCSYILPSTQSCHHYCVIRLLEEITSWVQL